MIKLVPVTLQRGPAVNYQAQRIKSMVDLFGVPTMSCTERFPLDERCDPLIIRGRYFVMMTVLDRLCDSSWSQPK